MASTTLFLATALFACVFSTVSAAEERKAIAVLKGDVVTGNVTFTQIDNGPVTVTGIVAGLTKGNHGFHIHAKGDISQGCITTMGHFNPDNKSHGGPTDEVRHVGDLGNIFAEDNGVANILIKDSIISLTGKNSILGRGVVVHSDADDLGRGGFTDSLTTGHAGTRVACGVIGILHPDGYWTKDKSSASALFSTVQVVVTLVASSFIARFTS